MFTSEMVLAIFAPLLAILPSLAAWAARALRRRRAADEARGFEDLQRIARVRRLAAISLWVALVVIAIELEPAPLRLPAALLAPLLLAIYAAALLVHFSLWGLIYRRVRRLAFHLGDYLRAALAIHLLVQPILLLSGFGILAALFLAPAPGGGAAAAATVAAALLAIYAAANFLQAPIGKALGALTPLPMEDYLAGAPGTDRIRGLYALRTRGIGFANAFAFPAGGIIAITTCALENLSPEETRAALRHEAGHMVLKSERAWRWTIILLGAAFVAASPFAGWLLSAAREHLIAALLGTLAALIALLVAGRMLNRAFERHADAFAAADPAAARALGAALLELGRINGIPEKKWRQLSTSSHPTVEKRLEALNLPRE